MRKGTHRLLAFLLCGTMILSGLSSAAVYAEDEQPQKEIAEVQEDDASAAQEEAEDITAKGEMSEDAADASKEQAPSKQEETGEPAADEAMSAAELSAVKNDNAVMIAGAPEEGSVTLSAPGFRAAQRESEGMPYNGLDNVMWVTLGGGKKAEDYKFTVTDPDNKIDDVKLNTGLSSEKPSLARWVYQPTKSGDYTINVYANSDADKTTSLGQATLHLNKVTFQQGNTGELFKGDGDKPGLKEGEDGTFYTFAENYEFVTFLPRPTAKVTGDGATFIGWLNKVPEKDKNYTSDDLGVLRLAKDDMTVYSVQGKTLTYSYEFNKEKNGGTDTELKISELEINLGQVTLGDAKTYKSIWIHNTGNTSLKLPEGDAGPFKVSAVIAEEDREAGGLKQDAWGELRATLRDTATAGSLTGTLSLRMQDSKIVNIVIRAEVVKGELSVELENVEKTYGETKSAADVKFKVTTSGMEDKFKTLGDLGLSIECEGFSSAAPVKAGIYEYGITNYGTKDYNVNVTNKGSAGVKVTKARPIVTVQAGAVHKGGTLKNSAVMVTAVNPNTDASVPGTIKWDDEDKELSVIGTDNYGYTFIPENKNNYEEVHDSTQVEVVDKIPTVLTPDITMPITLPYDGTAHGVTASARAEGKNRTSEVKVEYRLAGESEDSYTSELPVNAGKYDVRFSVPETYEYAGAELIGTLEITKKPVDLKVRYPALVTKVYDGTTSASLVSNALFVDVTDLLWADRGDNPKVTVNPNLSEFVTVEYSDANAGSGKTATITFKDNVEGLLQGERAANYTPNTTTLHASGGIITRKPAVVTVKESVTLEKKYGESLSLSAGDFEAEAGQLVDPDTPETIGMQVTCDGLSETAEVDTYPITVKTNDIGGNYDLTLGGTKTEVTVSKAKPKGINVSAGEGMINNPLSSVPLNGTFVNPYTDWNVKGTLEWKNPDEKLPSIPGKHSYEWEFTPNDNKNYESVSRTVEVTVTEKPPVGIELVGADSGTVIRTYNGQPQEVEVRTTPADVRAVVEYSLRDYPPEETPLPITLLTRAAEQGEEYAWSTEPPVNAGHYNVRVTSDETVSHAANIITGMLRVERAAPELSEQVTASEVEKAGFLTDSVLSGTFLGVDGKPLEGVLTWEPVGGESPNQVPVVDGKAYTWLFTPVDNRNYHRLTGTTEVHIAKDRRVLDPKKVEIYNVPKEYGDSAKVTVELEKYYNGDTITFYKDKDCTDPVSSAVSITGSGTYAVELDGDALSRTGGVLYLKIDGAEEAVEVTYLPELGFTLTNDAGTTVTAEAGINTYVGHDDRLSVVLSDESYSELLEKVEWTAEPETFISLTGDTDVKALSKTLHGEQETEGTRAMLSVTVYLRHPDSGNAEVFPIQMHVPVTVSQSGDLTVKSEIVELVDGTTVDEENVSVSYTLTLKQDDGTGAQKVMNLNGTFAATRYTPKKTNIVSRASDFLRGLFISTREAVPEIAGMEHSETTVTFVNGVASFTQGVNDLLVIHALPANTSYELTVTAVGEGLEAKEKVISGEIAATDENVATVELVQETSSLKVTKSVIGDLGEKDRAFHFKVELSDKLEGTFGEMTFHDGVAEFTLKDGQSVTAEDIPVGITYTVTEAEADKDGYTTRINGAAQGEIRSEELSEVVFINQRGKTSAAGSGSAGSSAKGSPQTGDNSHIVLWSVLMIASLLCAVVTVMFSLRRRSRVRAMRRRRRR